MTTNVVEKPDTITTDDGEHDRFTHYARVKDIERSMFEGIEIVAMCGKRWRPEGDFMKYPLCPTCKERYEALAK